MEYGISGSQFGLLLALHGAEAEGSKSLRLGDLVDRLLVRPPSITGVVDRLEAMGLVSRATDPADQRVKHVSLTGEGRALMGRMREEHGQRIEAIIGALDDSRREQLRGLLDQLSEHLEQMAGEVELREVSLGRNRT